MTSARSFCAVHRHLFVANFYILQFISTKIRTWLLCILCSLWSLWLDLFSSLLLLLYICPIVVWVGVCVCVATCFATSICPSVFLSIRRPGVRFEDVICEWRRRSHLSTRINILWELTTMTTKIRSSSSLKSFYDNFLASDGCVDWKATYLLTIKSTFALNADASKSDFCNK